MKPSPTQPAADSLHGLARPLLRAGWLSAAEAEAVRDTASAESLPFIDVLLRAARIDATALAAFIANAFRYPLLDLSLVDLAALPANVLEPPMMRSLRVIVLSKRANKLVLALADPTCLQAIDQVKFQTGLSVDPVIVPYPQLVRVLEQLAQGAEQTLAELVGEVEDDVALLQEDAVPAGADAETTDIDDAPVVRFLQKIMNDAIRAGASDLHFEPFEKFYRIRFRIDGELREVAQPPLAIKEKLASRIKVISRLDIAEKRVPQDGRMKLALSGTRTIDFRVSTLPTLFGEKIVMRVLDGSQARLGIDALGYEPGQRALLMAAIHRPHGMVLVTGPTGSGKTVSLYACLNLLNKPGINIATAEDPAEIYLAGVNQVNINERAGVTFPVVLRAFLRQDPDVLMVGEIRDLETADIAIKAAQTGHMVFSTLHTNDAPATITRLLNMGVAPFNIASAVRLITAQRLVRRLCACRQPASLGLDDLLAAGFAEPDLEGWTPYRAVGCERCGHTGYKGRVGVYQVMPVSEAIEALILGHGSALDIAAQARREGVLSLRQAALLKVRQGLTTLEEVVSCTND